jgi:hypothetical protein
LPACIEGSCEPGALRLIGAQLITVQDCRRVAIHGFTLQKERGELTGSNNGTPPAYVYFVVARSRRRRTCNCYSPGCARLPGQPSPEEEFWVESEVHTVRCLLESTDRAPLEKLANQENPSFQLSDQAYFNPVDRNAINLSNIFPQEVTE